LTATGELLVIMLCTTLATALLHVSGYCKHTRYLEAIKACGSGASNTMKREEK